MSKSIEEIEKMLEWLEDRIHDWEEKMREPVWGSGMTSQQCRESRNDYAGWKAEYDFLFSYRIELINKGEG